MSDDKENIVNAAHPGIPGWEAVMLANEDKLAEGIRWLERHGFTQLSVISRKAVDEDAWRREFGEGGGRVDLFVTSRDDAWRACLVCEGGTVSAEMSEGVSPFEAIAALSKKVPLEDILRKALGGNEDNAGERLG